MKERGILFKDRLVRAILRDVNPKTQTRRLVKPALPDEFRPLAVDWFNPVTVNRRTGQEEPGSEVFGCYDEDIGRRCPYGGPGDRLWVREAWHRHGDGSICFRATQDSAKAKCPSELGWKPGIHLFRRDARTVLEVVEVRVERLQDITEEDAIAEGVERSGDRWVGPVDRFPRVKTLYPTAKEAFRHLWDSINGDTPGASWAENPWVWCITFRRL